MPGALLPSLLSLGALPEGDMGRASPWSSAEMLAKHYCSSPRLDYSLAKVAGPGKLLFVLQCSLTVDET